MKKTPNFIVRIGDVCYPSRMFKRWKLSEGMHTFFSEKGGLPCASNYMIFGDPGVGKSTVCLDMLSVAQRDGAKVLFISCEMNKMDMYEYVERYPSFGSIDSIFPQNIPYEYPITDVLDEILQEGYDVVLIDSFVELKEIIRGYQGGTSTRAEQWILNLINTHNNVYEVDEEGIAKETTPAKHECFTSFLLVQQVNKGGNFVGTNKLKHLTTGTIEVRWDEDEKNRYAQFLKNRRGVVGKKILFDLDSEGSVNYTVPNSSISTRLEEAKLNNDKQIKASQVSFSEIFNDENESESGQDDKNEEPKGEWVEKLA